MKKHFVRLFPLLLISSILVFLYSSCKKTTDPTPTPTPPTPPPGKSDSTGNVPDTTPKKKWIVTTIAGSGVAGYADGDSNQVKFNYPTSLIVDSSGNLYLADVNNSCIRLITPKGHVTTYLKLNMANIDSTLGDIHSLTRDSQGNFYDIEDNHIRKITPTQSYAFAGTNNVYFQDGQGSAARFNMIEDITIDKQGNLYLPDYDMTNHWKMRKVTPSAYVSTMTLQDNTGFSSDLPVNTNLWYVYAIACDSTGNLYVAGNGSSLIKKITPQGVVTVLAGSTIGFIDGPVKSALFNSITGIAVDASGIVWVCDGGNHAIRKITPDGTVTTIAGNGTPGFVNGDSTTARFKFPSKITIDKKGALYVSDLGNAAVRKLVYQ